MKKILTTFVSLAIMVGLMAAAQASAAPSPARTTSAPPAAKPSPLPAKLSVLKGDKRLGRQQLKALGLKPVSGHQLAVLKQLRSSQKSNGAAKAASVGSYPWYTWHNAGFSWADRYYSPWFYYSSNYQGYVIYDNWKTCTYSGTGCIDADAYTDYYYYYYYGTWYTYGSPGFGPYPNAYETN